VSVQALVWSVLKYPIHDRDGKYPAPFDTVLVDAGITVVRSGVRVPRMNAVVERRVRANCWTVP
jgi:hypothetical protein